MRSARENATRGCTEASRRSSSALTTGARRAHAEGGRSRPRPGAPVRLRLRRRRRRRRRRRPATGDPVPRTARRGAAVCANYPPYLQCETTPDRPEPAPIRASRTESRRARDPHEHESRVVSLREATGCEAQRCIREAKDRRAAPAGSFGQGEMRGRASCGSDRSGRARHRSSRVEAGRLRGIDLASPRRRRVRVVQGPGAGLPGADQRGVEGIS